MHFALRPGALLPNGLEHRRALSKLTKARIARVKRPKDQYLFTPLDLVFDGPDGGKDRLMVEQYVRIARKRLLQGGRPPCRPCRASVLSLSSIAFAARMSARHLTGKASPCAQVINVHSDPAPLRAGEHGASVFRLLQHLRATTPARTSTPPSPRCCVSVPIGSDGTRYPPLMKETWSGVLTVERHRLVR